MHAQMNVWGDEAGTYIGCRVEKEAAALKSRFLLSIETSWPFGDKLEIRMNRAALEALINELTVASWSKEA